MKSINRIIAFAALITFFATGCQQENVNPETKIKQHDALTNDHLTWSSITVNNKEVEIQKLPDGGLIFNSDILLSPEDLNTLLESENGRSHGNSLGNRPWTGGIVYYQFAQGFPHTSVMRSAMQIIASQIPNLQFREGRGNGNYINIIAGGGNYSSVGMVGGRQNLSLSDARIGVAIHELGHAICLMHEHQRLDRDNHIRVNYNFIPASLRSQFNKAGTMRGTFDFLSMMMYPSRYRNGGYDMVRVSNNQPFNSNVETGYNRFSPGDISAIRSYYKF
jgi:hypothetical protein